MADLTILMTAAGAPQSPTLIRNLRNNGEKSLRIVGMDMDGEVSGRFFADGFHQIPAAGGPGYHERILEIVKREKPDALLNVSGSDVPVIARMKAEIEAMGTKVICSDSDAIELVNNKYQLYQTLKDVPGVDIPEHAWPKSLDEFVETARAMGYPQREVCFKPHVSKGSRGFRVLSERFDRADLLLNHKPTARYMALDEFISIFKGRAQFPDLMLMEVATGEEHDAMTIAWKKEALLTTVKSRESHRWGIIDKGAHVDRPEIVDRVRRIIGQVDLSYNISLQFIGGKLIEINPRTSTFIFQENLKEPWIAIKLGLGLITPEEVKELQSRVRIGRRMVRYMDQVFFEPDGSWSQ